MAGFLKHRSLVFCISLLFIVPTFLSACGLILAQHSESSPAVQIEAISPLPTIMETATSQSTIPPSPTFHIPPTPIPYTGDVTTSTPAPPTATPSKIINLAGDSPIEKTTVYVISRADGSHEEYIILNSIIPSDESSMQVISQLVNLGPEDKIVNSIPNGTRPMQPPPLPSDSSSTIQTPTK